MKITSLLSLSAIAPLLIPLAAYPQQRAKEPPPTHSQNGLPQQCARMQQMRQDMETRTSAQNDRLQRLLKAMDDAPSRRRVAAMSAVIHEMVAQRATRHTMSNRMQSAMAGHLREHMQQSDAGDRQKCPMMDDNRMMEKMHR